MFVDYINCLLEFTTYIELYWLFDLCPVPKSRLLLYTVLACMASFFFVFFPYHILILNMLIFCGVLCISLTYTPVLKRIYFSALSFLCAIILQFIFYSFLPAYLLQSNLGNLIGNLIMILFVGFLLWVSHRWNLTLLISGFVLRFKILLLMILVAFLLLGQFYLSRLSSIWSYLPDLISLSVLLLLIASVIVYIRYQQSADRLQARIFKQTLQSSQDLIDTMRIQLHDYKYHLHHLQNLIASAPTLSDLQSETTSYISQLNSDRTLYELLLSLNNPVMRAFLFGCYGRCRSNEIRFSIDTTPILPVFPLRDYQFIEVVENLFQNALEHTLTLDPQKRYIHIVLSAENGSQFFSIENPVDNLSLPLESLYIMNVSTKDDHSGLGLSSIQNILSQNHIHFSGMRNYDNGSIVFSFTYTEA